LRDGAYRGRCGNCEYEDICGGCRARAFVKSGDFMQEDPLCSYKPEGKRKVVISGSFSSDFLWDESAKKRIEKVPAFMRGMIIRAIELSADEKGVNLITSELIDELKERIYGGMHRKAGI
jgi:hypothetical protein